jgi:hypothetical protein
MGLALPWALMLPAVHRAALDTVELSTRGRSPARFSSKLANRGLDSNTVELFARSRSVRRTRALAIAS